MTTARIAVSHLRGGVDMIVQGGMRWCAAHAYCIDGIGVPQDAHVFM